MEHDIYLRTQLRMGEWIEAGLWMPIVNINYGYSRDLLNHLLGCEVVPRFTMVAILDDEQHQILTRLLGPHGYTYFRALLEQRGPFKHGLTELVDKPVDS